MDGFALLEKLGFGTTKKVKRGYCPDCNEKMDSKGNSIICKICGLVQNYVENVFEMSGYTPMSSKANSRVVYSHNEHQAPNDDNKIAGLILDLHIHLKYNNKTLNDEIHTTACQLMHAITGTNIKKADNRIQLFAATTFYASIVKGHILTIKEVSYIMTLNKLGISTGKKFIIDAILAGNNAIDINMPIYPLLIKKYLTLYHIDEKTNINTPENNAFCIDIIEKMLEYNIAYNSTILSKCVAVVYYLIQKKYATSINARRKSDFAKLNDVVQNTFIVIYNTLISSDVQAILNKPT